MSQIDDHGMNGREDATTARLLQLAGPRREVSAARAARVRAGVHQAWAHEIRRRRVRRMLLVVPASLAAAAAIVVAVYITRATEVAPAAVVGTSRDGRHVRAGEWIVTDSAARTAIRTATGTSVRVDAGSRVRLQTDTIVELTSGAVYVDTAEGAPALEIRTPYGTAIDIGTQFEVRLVAEALRVRVRTGAVAVKRDRESIQVGPGTEVTLTSQGAESRTVSRFGAEWEWAASLAPAVPMNGRPLAAFLADLSREHGWVVRYADAALAREASVIVLHGSVEGLQPAEAVSVALTTAGLSFTLEHGELLIARTRTKRRTKNEERRTKNEDEERRTKNEERRTKNTARQNRTRKRHDADFDRGDDRRAPRRHIASR